MNDEEIRARAVDFAKKNKIHIAKQLTDPEQYTPDITPISVFMAGSPGAGKTEFSKNLIDILEENKERRVVRIDSDELRKYIPGYTGNNSHLFQGAVSLIVEKMQDLVLHQKQSFVLDGTLSQHEKAASNINRSLEKSRPVFIFYIYQKPEVAWKFTQAREATEGRNIPKTSFIEQFFGAKDTINQISREFREKITILFVKKDFQENTVEDIVEIDSSGGQVDDFITERYTKDELEKQL